MLALNSFKKKSSSSPHFVVLDIGSDFVKALIIERSEEEGKELKVVGVGLAPQGLADTRLGVVADIKTVAKNVETALGEASLSCDADPREVVLGVSGTMVRGLATRVRLTRSHPDRPLTEKELAHIERKVRDAAFIECSEEVARARGQSNLKIKIINSEITGAEVDGFPVSGLLGFKGERVELSFFAASSLANHLHALETVVRSVGLKPVAVVSEMYALLKALVRGREPSEVDAVIVDIGGETTDIGIVFGGMVVATETLAIGGRDFTRVLSRKRDLPFPEAENLKLRYVAGETSPEETEAIRELLRTVSEIWLVGVREALGGMGEVAKFPAKVILCGGGSELPEITNLLDSDSFSEGLSFVERPQIKKLAPEDLDFFTDQTGRIDSAVWVLPLAVGYFAELGGVNQ